MPTGTAFCILWEHQTRSKKNMLVRVSILWLLLWKAICLLSCSLLTSRAPSRIPEGQQQCQMLKDTQEKAPRSGCTLSSELWIFLPAPWFWTKGKSSWDTGRNKSFPQSWTAPNWRCMGEMCEKLSRRRRLQVWEHTSEWKLLFWFTSSSLLFISEIQMPPGLSHLWFWFGNNPYTSNKLASQKFLLMHTLKRCSKKFTLFGLLDCRSQLFSDVALCSTISLSLHMFTPSLRLGY